LADPQATLAGAACALPGDGAGLKKLSSIRLGRIGAATALAVVFLSAKAIPADAFWQEPEPELQEASKAADGQATPHMVADPAAAMLDAGFRNLYELNFKDARAEFFAYQKAHPDDPLGKAAEAASYLFEEFNDKGVLTSAFFLNDERFLGGIEGSPNDNKNAAFLEANHQAHEIAKKAVKANPRDVHGLLVLTMTDGMESNYSAFIEKKQMSALSSMRQAESEANTLLKVDPTAMDAYVALGMSNYVIGSLPSYKKMFLWFGGVHGDRNRGIQQMSQAAEEGHYFKPFAKVMLALAYEREKQPERAKPLLEELSALYPKNSVFAHELALVEDKICCKR
jgi:tetratricopeptide (TPR) repeat protein